MSRLNRAYPGKDTTYVVDFINDGADILEAFRQYHTTAELADVSDPNVVLDLRNKLDATGCHDRFEIDRVAKVAVNPNATQASLDAAIGPISNGLGSFVRIYEFLGQMFDYGNTDYEMLYLFAKMLLPLLDYGRERDGIDLSVLRLTPHKMRDLGQQKLNLGAGNALRPAAGADHRDRLWPGAGKA